MREYKVIHMYEQYKDTHEFTKGKLERRTGAWKDRALGDLLEIHATAAPL